MDFWGGAAALLIYRLLATSLNGYTLFKAKLLSFTFPIKVLCERSVFEVIVGVSLPAMLGSLMVGPAIAAAMNFVTQQPNGLKELAYFSWVYQIYTVAIFVPNMLSGFFISKLSRGDGAVFKLSKVMRINFLFSLTVALIVYLLKGLLLRYAGSEYVEQASGSFDLMVVVIVLFGISASFASHWVAANRSWLGFGLNFIWAITLLLVVWLCGATYGGLALAIGFLCAYAFQLVVQSFVFRFQRKDAGVY